MGVPSMARTAKAAREESIEQGRAQEPEGTAQEPEVEAEPKPFAYPLPATVGGFDELAPPRKSGLNDAVQHAVRALYEKDEFRVLIQAVNNDEAIEGSKIADDFAACMMIRQYGVEAGNALIKAADLTDLKHALGVAMNRHKSGRKQRLKMLAQQ